MTKQTLTHTDSGTTYEGTANLGTATTEAGWSIKKTVVAGALTTVSYPIGSRGVPTGDEQFAWDDRAALNFSLTPDTTAPTLSTVTIESDNVDTEVANVGDEVTVTIVASEFLRTPVITIGGQAATVTQGADKKNWTAAYVMTEDDTEGVLPFTVDFQDIGGRAGTQVTATTDLSEVTFTIL